MRKFSVSSKLCCVALSNSLAMKVDLECLDSLDTVLQLKSVGPKLVPFFKTLTIYFVLFAEEPRLESPLYCAIKCLPIISLMFFVLLHGMSFSEYYSYSRKVTVYMLDSVYMSDIH